ncbi:I78 family peptidase inhibitor [uncultured Sphingomonas sp.]|uniref:I78 family peptidase inhibitor n=1 Tax=uncultured Sphingomonas sp. TaxID=158754 RepID=UPI00262DE376|nr:I78 family peptidase inhibitor [uncultured Sphingomonas sp.]
MIGRSLIALLLLAGCTTTAPKPGQCRADRAQDLVGKPWAPTSEADVLKRTGAKALRVIGPDTMVTMDYRIDRLNVETDAAGIVTRLRCG